jgi:hypothetical protein
MKTKTELKIYIEPEVAKIIQERQDEIIPMAFLLYPDTDKCDNDDLRTAFTVGVGYALWAVLVFDAPQSMDNLQKDAFMTGVVAGEKMWVEDH